MLFLLLFRRVLRLKARALAMPLELKMCWQLSMIFCRVPEFLQKCWTTEGMLSLKEVAPVHANCGHVGDRE